MLSASSTACLIDATVESMLTMTPFFSPRDGCVPTPMMSRLPSLPISATTAAIFVVPMSRPTMMSDDLLGMFPVHLPRVCRRTEIFCCRRRSVGRGRGPADGHAVAAGAVQVDDAQRGQAARAGGFEDLVQAGQLVVGGAPAQANLAAPLQQQQREPIAPVDVDLRQGPSGVARPGGTAQPP